MTPGHSLPFNHTGPEAYCVKSNFLDTPGNCSLQFLPNWQPEPLPFQDDLYFNCDFCLFVVVVVVVVVVVLGIKPQCCTTGATPLCS
jgi:hypothetical protein